MRVIISPAKGLRQADGKWQNANYRQPFPHWRENRSQLWIGSSDVQGITGDASNMVGGFR